MDLRCPGCDYVARIPDQQLPPPGARTRCPSCERTLTFSESGLVDQDATPPHGTEPVAPRTAPASAGGLAPQPPGSAAAEHGWRVRTPQGESGDLDLAQLKEMIRTDALVAGDDVLPPGSEAWLKASDCPDLGRYLALRTRSRPTLTESQALSQCRRHPAVKAAWVCPRCAVPSCEACVTLRDIGTVRDVRTCPTCGSACEPVKHERIAPTFHEDLAGLLTFPLRGKAWIALIGCAIAGAMEHVAVGVLSKVIISSTLFAYLLLIIRSGSRGEKGLPDLGRIGNYRDEMIWPGLKGLVVLGLITILPMYLYINFGMPAIGVYRESSTGPDGLDLNDPKLHLSAEEKSEARQTATVQEETQRAIQEARMARGTAGGGAEGSPDGASGGAQGGGQEADPTKPLEDLAARAGGGPDTADPQAAEKARKEAEATEHAFTMAMLRALKPIHYLVILLILAYSVTLLPMALILTALTHSIAPALKPGLVFQMIGEVKPEYLKLVGFCAALLVGSLLAEGLVVSAASNGSEGMRYAASFFASVVSYYFILTGFHALGRFAFWLDTKIDF